MKIVTFGELLLRLSGEGYRKLFQSDIFETSFCGAEANVAVSLAKFGLDSQYLTRVPDNDIGNAAINSLRYFGVDTSKIIRGGNRLGLYYLEKGASQRPSKIIYDRMGSAISEADINDFNWPEIFRNCKLFHFSGINPALSNNVSEICLDACRTAQSMGVTVSFDINYRSKLWNNEKASEVISEFMDYVDVCICNEEDAETIFDIKAGKSDVQAAFLEQESYKNVAEEICDRFDCKYVAITLRTSISASRNKWGGVLFGKEVNKCFSSKVYDVDIVDRVGSGDSFAAGLIYALVNNFNEKEAVEFAAAASCLKHSIEGDFNRISVEDVLALTSGSASGRVLR